MNTLDHGGTLILRGRRAIGHLAFLGKEPRNPLEAYPTLLAHGRPYNLWLTEQILQPVIGGWGDQNWPEPPPRKFVRDEFESASGGARLAFAQILPTACAIGDPAVLAALGVTANLQRTLAMLAEFISDDWPAAPDCNFRLSRHWCGLVEYRENAPYFPSRITPPPQSARLRPNRSDPGHLCSALWCSVADVKRRCAEAIDRLRNEVRQQRIFLDGPV